MLTKEQKEIYRSEMRAAGGNMAKMAEISRKWEAIEAGKEYKPATPKQNAEPLKVHCYRDHVGRLMLKIPESDPAKVKQPVFGFDVICEGKTIEQIQTILKNRTESHGQPYEFNRLSFYEPVTMDIY